MHIEKVVSRYMGFLLVQLSNGWLLGKELNNISGKYPYSAVANSVISQDRQNVDWPDLKAEIDLRELTPDRLAPEQSPNSLTLQKIPLSKISTPVKILRTRDQVQCAWHKSALKVTDEFAEIYTSLFPIPVVYRQKRYEILGGAEMLSLLRRSLPNTCSIWVVEHQGSVRGRLRDVAQISSAFFQFALHSCSRAGRRAVLHNFSHVSKEMELDRYLNIATSREFAQAFGNDLRTLQGE